jgi:hypothetical protein
MMTNYKPRRVSWRAGLNKGEVCIMTSAKGTQRCGRGKGRVPYSNVCECACVSVQPRQIQIWTTPPASKGTL